MKIQVVLLKWIQIHSIHKQSYIKQIQLWIIISRQLLDRNQMVLKLEKRSENISEMNDYIWRKFNLHIQKKKNLIKFYLVEKRKDTPYTYTDIYLGFQVSEPQEDNYKIQTLSSNLITGYEVVSVASDIFLKYALNDTSASIQTTLIYKKTGRFTIEPNYW